MDEVARCLSNLIKASVYQREFRKSRTRARSLTVRARYSSTETCASPPCAVIASSRLPALPSCRNGGPVDEIPHKGVVRKLEQLGTCSSWQSASRVPMSCLRRSEYGWITFPRKLTTLASSL